MPTLKKKVVLLGDSAVGKTSLIRRYVLDQFDEGYIATIGSRVSKKRLGIEGRSGTFDLTLMIWDVVGSQGYRSLHARTFVGVNGAILVADLTRRETLESLERYWLPFLLKVVEEVPVVFLGNKSDLTEAHEFALDDLAGVAAKHNAAFDEDLPPGGTTAWTTSAKSGENVERAFETMGHLLLARTSSASAVKELYEGLLATGIQRYSDRTTAVGALDAIMMDFCRGFEDSRTAMSILRQELTRAGIDIGAPTKPGLLRAVGYLAEAESEYKDERAVRANLERRKAIVEGVRDARP